MNMFLVFAGEEYYPGGGWSDFVGAYPTQQEAKEVALTLQPSWWHIVDLNVMEEVESDF